MMTAPELMARTGATESSSSWSVLSPLASAAILVGLDEADEAVREESALTELGSGVGKDADGVLSPVHRRSPEPHHPGHGSVCAHEQHGEKTTNPSPGDLRSPVRQTRRTGQKRGVLLRRKNASTTRAVLQHRHDLTYSIPPANTP